MNLGGFKHRSGNYELTVECADSKPAPTEGLHETTAIDQTPPATTTLSSCFEIEPNVRDGSTCPKALYMGYLSCGDEKYNATDQLEVSSNFGGGNRHLYQISLANVGEWIQFNLCNDPAGEDDHGKDLIQWTNFDRYLVYIYIYIYILNNHVTFIYLSMQ